MTRRRALSRGGAIVIARGGRAAAALALAAGLAAGCGAGPADGPRSTELPAVPTARGLPPPTADAAEPDDGGSAEDPAGGERDGKPRNEVGVEADARAGTFPLPAAQPVSCPGGGTTVTDAASLTAALSAAGPGTVIRLADGVYEGKFVTRASGTAAAPAWLCGGRGAVLDGGSVKGGYVLHLNGATHWRIVGFAIRNGQKGLMADGTVGSVIQDLAVSGVGDEAVHLRRHSTDNLVIGNEIAGTGNRRDKFGEGVYIGTAISNWCTITACLPDRSDRNVITGNTIRDTTSESVDIKEGTTGGLLAGNTFDGSGTTAADSWVDVKGTAWTIVDNRGTATPLDGFQTHQIEDRWGERNVFERNTVTSPPTSAKGDEGYGFALRPVGGNVVRCDNVVSGGIVFANVDCR